MAAALSEPTASLRSSTAQPASTVLYSLTLALAISLPFEPIQPLLATPWLELNHLKLLLAASGIVWLVSSVSSSSFKRIGLPRSLWPAAMFLAIAGLSALQAPADRGDALKFIGRLASGLYALALVLHVATTPSRVTGLLWAVIIGAGISAGLGLGEAAHWRALDPLLTVFKVAPTRVGGDLRVSASFQYATIAAMFFELTAPLAVMLAATTISRSARLLAVVIAAACSIVVVLTLTRAGIAALAVAFAVLLGLAWARPYWRRLALPTAIAASSAAIVVVGLATSLTIFSTRITTENDWDWYGATYQAPAGLAFSEDASANVIVTVRNTGLATWTRDGDHPFALAYRWLSSDDASEFELPSTVLDLPRDVPPGDTIQLPVEVSAALPPGDYRLAWGMLQQNVLWFHDRGSPDAETVVHVAQGQRSAGLPAVSQEPRSDLDTSLAPVPRSELWTAALRIIAQHPLLGIGPDNFRHLYGPYLGLAGWDERVHANNLYLELLADMGTLGAVAFGVVLAPAIAVLVRGVRQPSTGAQALVIAGLTASLLAFFLHGVFDYFLEFTPVYLLFWLVVGLSMNVGNRARC